MKGKKFSKRLLSLFLSLVMVLGVSSIFASAEQSAEAFETKPMVSAGSSHTLALKSDGTVLAWGLNFQGQLGDGTRTERSVPAQVKDLTNVISVAAGGSHSLALKSDGTVWAWGSSDYGRLGNGLSGVEDDSSVPVQVKDLTNVTSISAGSGYSLAVKSDSTVWAWGENDYGQLGDGTKSDSSVPVLVMELTNVVAVAAGSFHSLALKSDGTVWAWGYNNYGQFGNATTSDSSVPIQVTNLTDFIAISAGGFYSLALKNDGTVWAWGNNEYGQLGNGASGYGTYSSVPVQVKNLADVSNISAGDQHSLAVRSNGTVWAWGINSEGQLGNNTTDDSNVPVEVIGLSDVITISAGNSHSLALKSDNTVWAWGWNEHGQLGDASPKSDGVARKTTPIQVLGIKKKGYMKLDSASINFTDVAEGDWYYKAVQYSAKNDLMVGTSATTFKPNSNMTRGMVATVLYKLEGTPDVYGTAYFTDVADGEWYTDAVNWAYETDIISGYGGGIFGPDDNISREQLAAMMRYYTLRKGLDISGAADLSGYTDSGDISGWAVDAVKWAVDSGLISGTTSTTLDPLGTATRAECATILMNWMTNIAA